MCTNTEQPVILSFFFCIVILGNFENNQISASSKLLQKIIKLSLSFRPEFHSRRADIEEQGEGSSEHIHLQHLWQDDDGQDEDEEAR